MDPYGYCYNNPINLIDPDGKLPIIPIIWGAIEVGGAIYDGYQAYKTLSDKNATTGEKWAAAGGVALGAVLPGAGYGTGAKTTVKAVDKAIDAKKVVKNADAIAEGRKFEADQLARSVSEGKNVTRRNRLVPQNGKGNVKGNRTDTDQLIKNNDGTFSIKETKRSSSTRQSKGQKATQRHVESGNGIFEVRTNQPSQGLRKGDKIQVKNYERINKHD